MRFFEALRDVWQEMDAQTRMKSGYALIALLVAALAWSALAGRVALLEKKRAARETVVKELLPLKVSYRIAKQSSDQLAGRMSSLRPDDTPAKIIEEIGIRGKGVKISPLKGDERNGVIEDAADVRIEGLTLNEAVNLVYRLEKGSRPLVMKKCNLKIRFDDPSRCDMAMTLALLRPAAGQPR
jgi:general secretion pathway protein M